MVAGCRSAEASALGVELTGRRCAICGWCAEDVSGHPLSEGAHVREFSSGHEFDVPQNIIALCPNHHTEYDAHLFYIDPQTKRLHAHRPGWKFEGVDLSDKIRHVKQAFLAYAKYQYDEFWSASERKHDKGRWGDA